jgi:hypothetical protein
VLGGGGSSASVACAGGDATGATQSHTGSGGTTLDLGVDLTCGDMTVARAAGGTWQVDVRAGDQTPTVDQSGTGLSLRSVTTPGVFLNGDERESWQVTLPTESDLSASLTVSAGTLHAQLGNGPLRDVSATFNAADGTLDMSGATGGPVSLSATVNAASVGVTLPQSGVAGSITVNAGSLQLCAAPDLGLRLTFEQQLSSNNFATAGLSQIGNAWQSANYATAPAKVDLHISANVSSTTLNPEGGCK